MLKTDVKYKAKRENDWSIEKTTTNTEKNDDKSVSRWNACREEKNDEIVASKIKTM